MSSEEDGALGRRVCDTCPFRVVSDHRIGMIEKDLVLHTTEIKELQALAAQVRLLMSLSIGGGGLSIVTLIVTLVQLV